MMPATEVGGDYYDVLAVDDGCWIAIGDVSGHGLTAGLVMMMVQTGVATLVRAQPGRQPQGRDQGAQRASVRERPRSARGRAPHDAVAAALPAQRRRSWSRARTWTASCGARPRRRTELLGTPGTFLAITEDIDHVNQEVTWQLADGDLLVLLTDGVTEAEDAAGRPFDYRGVTQVVEAHATAPVEAIRDAAVRGAVRAFPRAGG